MTRRSEGSQEKVIFISLLNVAEMSAMLFPPLKWCEIDVRWR
jgi:hypothetical protein